MFPNVHSLEESIQLFVFGIIIFTTFRKIEQPSRFLLGGKKLSWLGTVLGQTECANFFCQNLLFIAQALKGNCTPKS